MNDKTKTMKLSINEIRLLLTLLNAYSEEREEALYNKLIYELFNLNKENHKAVSKTEWDGFS